ncbi:hypothetical protein FXO37_15627 [Capsicum annuum]|nr:hypothetical protein FXO37_15627 [Capsicum annuum]
MGSVGARELTVLGEFKPFGLIAEALDGKPSDTCVADYRYFLFSPQVTKQRDEADELDLPSPSSDWSDHELFIRGNRIIWSIGLRVYKRFTLPSAVIKACWCQMGDTSDTVLCILQCDSLSIYDTSGEVTSVPLPRSITSIWALPYGLLLQQAPEGSSQAHIQFSSLSPLLSEVLWCMPPFANDIVLINETCDGVYRWEVWRETLDAKGCRLSSVINFQIPSPPIFSGENYPIWALKMRTYLRAYDLWEVVEVGGEVNPLPNNPTMTQIKNHREKVSKNFKALSCIQLALPEVIFARVMASETAKEAWDKLKEEFHGSDKIRQIKVINLR